MKRILFVLAVLFSISTFAQTAAEKEKVKSLMQDEKSVKDYVLTNAQVLYVSVSDNGSNRDGLASYFCDRMKELRIKVFKVKVVKYGSQKDSKRDNAYGVKLGECQCQ
ncbi:MAG: hypothetical protein WCG93_14200 [Paludibacter sp.]